MVGVFISPGIFYLGAGDSADIGKANEGPLYTLLAK
jgi:hypothetical protein